MGIPGKFHLEIYLQDFKKISVVRVVCAASLRTHQLNFLSAFASVNLGQLHDPRCRSKPISFGKQWVNVRGLNFCRSQV